MNYDKQSGKCKHYPGFAYKAENITFKEKTQKILFDVSAKVQDTGCIANVSTEEIIYAQATMVAEGKGSVVFLFGE